MNSIKNIANQWLHQKLSGSPAIILVAVLVTSIMIASTVRFNKNVSVVADGKTLKVSTYRSKVADVLKAADITLDRKDKVTPGLESSIANDMTIRVKRAVPVEVAVDGKELEIKSAEDTVKDMLKSEGIVLNEKDKITPGLNSAISNDLQIKIVRVENKVVTVQQTVAYKTISRKDNSMARGKTKVVQDGEDGQKQLGYNVTYEDGKEVSRSLVSETFIKPAVNKIVAIGTLGWFKPSRGGDMVYYTRKIRMKATSYTANFACTGKNPGDSGFGITATGTTARRDPNGYSTVAVDTSIIPLGTKLYIQGYGYAIAEDVGGGVRGNIIDLYFEPGTEEFRSWYTHYVDVYIVK